MKAFYLLAGLSAAQVSALVGPTTVTSLMQRESRVMLCAVAKTMAEMPEIQGTSSPVDAARVATSLKEDVPATSAVAPQLEQPPSFRTWKQSLQQKARSDTLIMEDATVKHSAAVTTVLQKTLPKKPTFQTWTRRLDTHEDPFNLHKWAGLGWLVSATAIFGTGTLSGFTEAPAVLEPYTYLFVIANLAQSASSIPMALKYRRNEPAVQRGFISSALTTSSLAVTGYWLSPFANDDTLLKPSVVAGFIGFVVLADAIYSLTSFEDMKQLVQSKMKDIDPAKKAKAWAERCSTLLSTVPVGLPLNLILLHELLGHGEDARNYFLSAILEKGSSLDLVYYALMVTSIGASVGNLAVTLHHRKLISKELEDLATIGAQVVTLLFNFKAAGLF